MRFAETGDEKVEKPKQELERKLGIQMSEACRLRRLSIAELRITTHTPTTRLVMADMLRCIGKFPKARDQVSEVLVYSCEDNLHDVAKFMHRFIDGRESSPRILCRPERVEESEVIKLELDDQLFSNIRRSRRHVELNLLC